MRRRLALILFVLLVLGVGTVLWTVAGLPPPMYLLRYGLTPGCEPTGETVTLEDVTFVEIGPGIFRMGSNHLAKGDLLGRFCATFGLPWGEQPEPSDEMPVHWVEFRRGFWISRREITNAQYERFDPGHPRSEFSYGDKGAVVDVSWKDAMRYCAWLAEKSGREIRLPSEAEWECACRAGGESEFCFGNEEDGLAEYAWFDANAQAGPREVGTRRANAWGLFDLHGNVWEWCVDRYHASYDGAPTDGSAWGDGAFRVIRGGNWCRPAEICRSANRFRIHPGDRGAYLGVGFRPAFAPSDP